MLILIGLAVGLAVAAVVRGCVAGNGSPRASRRSDWFEREMDAYGVGR